MIFKRGGWAMDHARRRWAGIEFYGLPRGFQDALDRNVDWAANGAVCVVFVGRFAHRKDSVKVYIGGLDLLFPTRHPTARELPPGPTPSLFHSPVSV